MPITYSNAIDEMFGVVNGIDMNAVIGYAPEIRWPGAPVEGAPDPTKFWLRVSQQIVTDKQDSLANSSGSRKYRANGLLYVQIFAPRNVVNSASLARSLGEVIRDAFRKPSPSGAIDFSNQQVRELPASDQAYPFNVVVTYGYDSVGPA